MACLFGPMILNAVFMGSGLEILAFGLTWVAAFVAGLAAIFLWLPRVSGLALKKIFVGFLVFAVGALMSILGSSLGCGIGGSARAGH
jgi:hypothetical protein